MLLGQCTGHRDHRRPPSLAALATTLMEELQRDDAQALDSVLGPVAGILLDHKKERALVWRDRFGRIPMQLVELRDGWCVTTSPEAVGLVSAGRPRRSVLANYLSQNRETTPLDFFDDVERIRPGECVLLTAGGVHRRQFWWAPRPAKVDPHKAGAAMAEVVQRITDPWRRTPHILTLSGGIDSAVIAAVATRHQRASRAVTLVDPLSPRSELAAAAQTAKALSLRWTCFDIRNHWPLSRLGDHRLPPAWGPPAFPDAAWRIPMHRWLRPRFGDLPLVCGNGADEALWISSADWLRHQWQHLELAELARAARHLSFRRWAGPGLRVAFGDARFEALRPVLPVQRTSLPVWQCPDHWLHSDLLRDCSPPADDHQARRLDRLKTLRWELAMRSIAQEERLTGRKIFAPFLDPRFWELSLGLTIESLVVRGRQKAVLRQLVADQLPMAWATRQKFGGFDDLVERGLAEREVPRVIGLIARSQMEGWARFDREAFLTAFEAYRRPPRLGEHRASYRGSWAIWSTLAAELWLRRCRGF